MTADPHSHATLGTRRDTPFTYSPELLEAIPWHYADTGEAPWVSNNCLRFTSLCPVTGQPDWADLTINYIPDRHLVESKSLKEYLGSFRMHGDFHEAVCRLICDDLSQRLKPRYLEVIGAFDSRGSIAIWPYVQYAQANNEDMQALLRHRRLNYSPGAYTASSYQRQI